MDNATLTRFFTLHFILPFIILFITLIHLISLHNTGSTNPLGLNRNIYKIPFHIYFTFKDILYFILIIIIFFIIIIQYPYILLDVDNFIKANPLNTPIHIQPE
ncbi:hypothetical protein EUZ93_01065 [Wolbachia pipientis]|nr:hypothetical protein [Wolbachia pipientis]NEV49103.1 hypothetical protein [Wolbachia pipientis]